MDKKGKKRKTTKTIKKEVGRKIIKREEMINLKYAILLKQDTFYAPNSAKLKKYITN